MGIQIIPRGPTLSEVLGQAAGKGVGTGIEKAGEYALRRSRLQEAFQNAQNQPKGNFLQQLGAIAPALLALRGPEGAQALEAIAPILGRQAQAQVGLDALNEPFGQPTGPIAPEQPPRITPEGTPVGPEDKFLRPEPPVSPESTYPERTVGPQLQPELSAQQIQGLAKNIVRQSIASGQPIGMDQALQSAQSYAKTIVDQNDRVRQQQDAQIRAQSAITEGIINRANNLGLVRSPEDRTVLEKFALEAPSAGSETERWEYVRPKMQQYYSAKEALKRTYDVPGPLDIAYRKLFGSYKTKEQAMQDLQRPLDFYRKNGLYGEARNDLVNSIGMGPEDAEMTLFPLSKAQESQINKIAKNPRRDIPLEKGDKVLEQLFPSGSRYELNEEQFPKFKETLADLISKNPDMNLIVLRGRLNQEKAYAWEDVNKAIAELISENRFIPNTEQEAQLNIIRSAPMPGMGQWFDFLWKGTK